ncbi:AbrB family transcriptional regulator [Clostridium sp. Marseille-P2415]|uniref:AbrB family transcriptional regulator n=1 Tax=Clostridium sp. Marseille-P2415 TaxID=1805471 RepID=UPI0009887ABB|nr:AbrB family transcriptional regulator [Clostridium sp. Marseille-P2415]
MERKIISVSIKRQVTIPQKYFDALGFNNEAECILQEGGILIRPVRDTGGSEFSEQILADLIAQGFEGAELLERFKQQSKKVRPAVQKMIEEADALVQGTGGKTDLDKLFGAEE